MLDFLFCLVDKNLLILRMVEKMQIITASEIEKQKSTEMTERATGAMKIAEEYNPVVIEDITEGKEHVKSFKLQKAFFNEIYDPHIKEANKMHKGLTSGKKRWTDHIDKAEGIVRDKMKTFLLEEDKRKQKEAEDLAEKKRKERDAELSKAKQKIVRLRDSVSKKEDLLNALQVAVNDPNVTDAERECYTEEINVVKNQIKNAEQKASVVSEQATQDVPIVEAPVEKTEVKGVSHKTVWIPQNVTNPMLVLKQIISGEVPMDVITFNMQTIKKLSKNGVKIAGVAYKEDKDLRIS
jgi:hypothetical protein